MEPAPSATRKIQSGYYGLGVIGVTLLAVVIRFSIWPSDYNFGNLIVSFITGICLGLIVLGLTNREQKKDQNFG